MDAFVDVPGLDTVLALNALPLEVSEQLYVRLVPPELLARFGVSPDTFMNARGERLLRIAAPAGQPWARIELRVHENARDPVLLLDVGTSAFGVPELAFMQVNDPDAPRFAIDRGADGQDTLLGTVERNHPEEARALGAGLAPGQVRRGLRLLGRVLECMDDFCSLLGREFYLVEPLFYHSAVAYERHGCDYLAGRELMAEIDAGFARGADLELRLDGSTPFRDPANAATARGRSWAIHDGILGREWGPVKMYRITGGRPGVATFTGPY
jgi:hypothetical protein